MFISNAYAQAAGAAPSTASAISQFALPVLMIVVLYFVMVRPQMKRQKEVQAMLGALKKGDEVVTQGGLLGKIAKLDDTYATLEIAPGTQVQVQRVAIIQVLQTGTIK